MWLAKWPRARPTQTAVSLTAASSCLPATPPPSHPPYATCQLNMCSKQRRRRKRSEREKERERSQIRRSILANDALVRTGGRAGAKAKALEESMRNVGMEVCGFKAARYCPRSFLTDLTGAA